jgi:hypothetical protein
MVPMRVKDLENAPTHEPLFATETRCELAMTLHLNAAVPDDGMLLWDHFENKGLADPRRFLDGFWLAPWVQADAKPPPAQRTASLA